MPAFSITPLTDIPPPAAESFPQFIQFQEDGTDLGLPDADTLNFANGLTATRGTGENSNVVTVTGGASGGSSASLIQLTSPGDAPVEESMFFDGNNYIRYWNSLVVIESADWTWLDESGDTRLLFNTAGIYRITTTSFIDASGEWPDGDSTFGSVAGDSASAQARHHVLSDPVDTRTRMQWTDQFIYTAEAESQIYLGLYALATATESAVQSAQMQVIIERIADVPA